MLNKIKLFTKTVLVFIFFIIAMATGSISAISSNNGSLMADSKESLLIKVDTSRHCQQIRDFGASDCWTMQVVGNWPKEKTEAIADLLFSSELDSSGKPVGIGLSSWRMNLGAGSARQDNIFDSWRKGDCFLDDEMNSYDWQRCSGQRKFLQLAKSRGVSHFTAFCNSPLINMTRNGNAFCDPSIGTTNLNYSKAKDFANYIADVLEYFRDSEGIEFDNISPVNEPEWDWNQKRDNPARASQEGCRYNNVDIKLIVDVLAPSIKKRGLKTVIEICESGSIEYLYSHGIEKGEHIRAFFEKGSSYYLGDKIPPVICSHSYWTDIATEIVQKREMLRRQLDKYGLDYVQSEYSILGDRGEINGNGRDLGIDPALWVARVIHTDLTVARAVSWQWWTAVSPVNYKDGLVYCDRNDSDGNYYQSKMLWAFGNFSRFIRPGMYRVELDRSDKKTALETVNGLMASSYYSTLNNTVVVVLVNYSHESAYVKLEIPNQEINGWQPYVTAGNNIETDSLSPYELLSSGSTAEIPARSVVTFVSTSK